MEEAKGGHGRVHGGVVLLAVVEREAGVVAHAGGLGQHDGGEGAGEDGEDGGGGGAGAEVEPAGVGGRVVGGGGEGGDDGGEGGDEEAGGEDGPLVGPEGGALERDAGGDAVDLEGLQGAEREGPDEEVLEQGRRRRAQLKGDPPFVPTGLTGRVGGWARGCPRSRAW